MSTLLVIDDDRAVLYTIERTFQGTGVSVLTAKTVREGLELIERKPDVVLLDIMLPEGSGLEAVEVEFTDSGRIPGTALQWPRTLGFRGRLFSDNLILSGLLPL